jgi:hypothetical protein
MPGDVPFTAMAAIFPVVFDAAGAGCRNCKERKTGDR